MAQHEYSSLADRDVNKVLRAVEAREGAGWDLVTLVTATTPVFFASTGMTMFTAVMRRPLGASRTTT